jgi:hypothetical protein
MTRALGSFLSLLEADSRTVFYTLFSATFIVKVWLAFVVPITGDEALFYWWGINLSWGYYDHPPMVGWMLGLLTQFGDTPVILRLVTVASTFLVAFGLVDLVARLIPGVPHKKWVAGSLYLLTPISWFGVPVTNDTPLLMFVFFAIYLFVRGERSIDLPKSGSLKESTSGSSNSSLWFLASGVLLGLAFLSKYLALVVLVSFLVALFRPARWGGHGIGHACKATLLIMLGVSPFGLINLTYNACNCWNNVMFNLFNRNEGASIGIENPLIFLLMIGYLFTPWLLWSMVRSGHKTREHILLLLIAVLPLAFFLIVSLVKTVGLHWMVGFLPMVFVFAAVQLSRVALIRCLKWTFFFSISHLFLFVGVFAAPSYWMSYPAGAKALGFVYDAPRLVVIAMQGAGEGTTLMAEGYSPGAILGYHAGQYVPVFGVGSRYARQDDFQVDFREFDGRSIRVLLRRNRSESDFAPYFDNVKITPLSLEGRLYWVVEGTGFRFNAYREMVLMEIAKRFYQIPPLLPVFACPFLEKYRL